MNPIIKTNKSKHILARIWLLNGLPVETKLIGINDPRIEVYKEACVQGLIASYEIVEMTCTSKTITHSDI
jgi:hypothetical protein